MFDLFNMGGQNGFHINKVVKNTPVYEDIPTREVKTRYLLYDYHGETEVDKDYMDYLISTGAVTYDGMITDTYNNECYRYQFNGTV